MASEAKVSVLILSSGHPRQGSLTGIFEYDQAKALVNIGCQVVFVALDYRSVRSWRKWGVLHFKSDGMDNYILNLPLGRVSRLLRLYLYLIGFRYLFARVRKDGFTFQVIHAHFTDMGWVAVKAGSYHLLPVVITEHSSLIRRAASGTLLAKIAAFAYAGAKALVAVSPELTKLIQERFGVGAKYIPNTYDSSVFSYKPCGKSLSFRFVSVGSLTVEKGMLDLVKGFHAACQSMENMSLVIFGKGPLQNTLDSFISNNQLGGKITLRGQCQRSDLAQEFRSSDCFVLASHYETFGVSYVEAMAVGLPVIATRCGGPEAFVTPANGFLVAIGDPEGLAEAMLAMVKGRKNYNRPNIARATYDHFSPESVARQLNTIYSDLIAAKNLNEH